jgi:PKD repeat protein
MSAARILTGAVLAGFIGSTAYAQGECAPPTISSAPSAGLAGRPVTFISSSDEADWDFGDGTAGSGATVNHTYANPGSYWVFATSPTPCGPRRSSAYRMKVDAVACEQPAFTFSPPAPVRGQEIEFTSQQPGATWTFGDGVEASGNTVAHAYQDPGEYYVILTADTACGRMAATPRRIRVHDITCSEPRFAISPEEPLRGQQITFTTALPGASWDFGDGSLGSGSSTTHTYPSPGNYPVTLTARTACGVMSAAPRMIRIFDFACQAPTFSLSTTNPRRGDVVAFQTALGGARWDFGDGSVEQGASVSHSYASPGTYRVVLTVDTACGRMESQPLNLRVDDFACELPDFQYSPSAPLRGQEITFTTGSLNPQWAFSDGGTAATATVYRTFESPGTYLATLTAGTTCGSERLSKTKAVVVDDFACEVPGFIFAPLRPAAGDTIVFQSIFSDAIWDFGDGTPTQSGRIVSHTYPQPGQYGVVVTATTACGILTAPARMVTVEALICELPTFQYFPNAPVVGQVVTFTASAPDAEWDFADGTRASGASVTHAFTRPGAYNVTVTAGSRCGHLRSNPQSIHVVDFGCPLPTFTVTTTSPDVGQAVTFSTAYPSPFWTFGDGATSTESAPTHQYSESGIFDVRLRAMTTCGEATSNPVAMVVGGARGLYQCKVRLRNGYGLPASGERVFFGAYRFQGPLPIPIKAEEHVTEGNGELLLTLELQQRPEALYCAAPNAYPVQAGLGPLETSIEDREGIKPGTPLELSATIVPRHDDARTYPGRVLPDVAVSRLYRSGAYDKVVLIPEPFDPDEYLPRQRRTREKLWRQFAPVMQALHRFGYDVWLVEPDRTAQNLHEQAAQYAQAVRGAVEYGPGAAGGKAVLFGYSMGGVVLRIATARWEADAEWRDWLGLPPTLPASLVLFGDSPLRGAVVNAGMQNAVWKDEKLLEQSNLAGCSAQQMLKLTCHGETCTQANFVNFFSNGTSVTFPNSAGSRCDTVVGGQCVCHAGPAVFGLNGDGWPHTVRKIAFSNGSWEPDSNMCYGDWRDRNSAGFDICPRDPGGQGFWQPQVGDSLVDVNVLPLCPVGNDQFVAHSFDVEPGSRHDSILDQEIWPLNVPMLDILPVVTPLCAKGVIRQRFGGTFIPIRSSLATDNPASSPFAATRNNAFQGTHSNAYGDLFAWALREFEAAQGTNQAVNAPPVATQSSAPIGEDDKTLEFEGNASSDPEGTIVSYKWSFGDGTEQAGSSVTHQYQSPGSYVVSLTVTDDDGQDSTVAVRTRVALSTNELPEPIAGGPYTGVIGSAVQFDASASADDGWIVAYEWDFGDGTEGTGRRIEHVYAANGSYDATLTVRDNDGVSALVSVPVVIRPNGSPSVAISKTSTCAPHCAVTFTASPTDPDGDPISVAWSGCVSGAGLNVTCEAMQAQTLQVAATVTDSLAASSTAVSSASVVATSYAVGSWGSCAGTGTYSCSSAGPAGCSRPGTQARSVTESSWAADTTGVTAPASTQACTQTADGYIAGYSVGSWGACSAGCGGGVQYRSVTASSWKATSPHATAPAASQACNTHSCELTCYDYPDTYPTRSECLSSGWPVCERRFRSNGVGGQLECWKGFQ